jgi:ABC-2 type transport system ATP-binding protein
MDNERKSRGRKAELRLPPRGVPGRIRALENHRRMTETPAIDIRDLRVDYGDFVAVHDVTLAVPRGEVFGLVGPNGAGKTSTFRVMATLMEPTYGEVRLAGIDIAEAPEAARQVLGYMPDLAPVPSDLKVHEFLDLFAAAHQLGNGRQRRERIDACLEEVRLTDARGKFCKTLSRGQTQRLVLAKTLLHRPQVMVLDEPASGMDPLSRRHLRLVLRKLCSEGVTVIVSSHILSELAEMCTSLCVMNHGRVLSSGSVEEVRRQLGRSERLVRVTLLDRAEEALRWLESRAHITAAVLKTRQVQFHFTGDEEEQCLLITDFIGAGFRVLSIEEQRSSFEDILLDVAEGGAA